MKKFNPGCSTALGLSVWLGNTQEVHCHAVFFTWAQSSEKHTNTWVVNDLFITQWQEQRLWALGGPGVQIRTVVACQGSLAWQRRSMESSGICRCWQGPAPEHDRCWLCLQLFLYRRAERQQELGAKISPTSLATHRPLKHTHTQAYTHRHPQLYRLTQTNTHMHFFQWEQLNSTKLHFNTFVTSLSRSPHIFMVIVNYSRHIAFVFFLFLSIHIHLFTFTFLACTETRLNLCVVNLTIVQMFFDALLLY